MAEEKPPTTPPDGEKKKTLIYSIRPKADYLDFLNQLVTDKGSIAAALEHCILTTRDGVKPVPAPAPVPAPVPAPRPSGIQLSEADKTKLLKIQGKKRRNLSTDAQAITYCIDYTLKNDWL